MSATAPPKLLLTAKELAALRRQLAIGWLAADRYHGDGSGPPYLRLGPKGASIRYWLPAVDAWLATPAGQLRTARAAAKIARRGGKS